MRSMVETRFQCSEAAGEKKIEPHSVRGQSLGPHQQVLCEMSSLRTLVHCTLFYPPSLTKGPLGRSSEKTGFGSPSRESWKPARLSNCSCRDTNWDGPGWADAFVPSQKWFILRAGSVSPFFSQRLRCNKVRSTNFPTTDSLSFQLDHPMPVFALWGI